METVNIIADRMSDAEFLAANPGFQTTREPGENQEDDQDTSSSQTTQLDLDGLKNLQASLITTTMEALQKKKAKKLEPHLEEALLKSLGNYPAGGKGDRNNKMGRQDGYVVHHVHQRHRTKGNS